MDAGRTSPGGGSSPRPVLPERPGPAQQRVGSRVVGTGHARGGALQAASRAVPSGVGQAGRARLARPSPRAGGPAGRSRGPVRAAASRRYWTKWRRGPAGAWHSVTAPGVLQAPRHSQPGSHWHPRRLSCRLLRRCPPRCSPHRPGARVLRPCCHPRGCRRSPGRGHVRYGWRRWSCWFHPSGCCRSTGWCRRWRWFPHSCCCLRQGRRRNHRHRTRRRWSHHRSRRWTCRRVPSRPGLRGLLPPRRENRCCFHLRPDRQGRPRHLAPAPSGAAAPRQPRAREDRWRPAAHPPAPGWPPPRRRYRGRRPAPGADHTRRQARALRAGPRAAPPA